MTIIEGHFVRIHADPYYTTGNPVMSAADWAQFDQEVSQLLNGDLGGTWAPLTLIQINGSGLTLTAPLYVVGPGTVMSTASGAFEIVGPANMPQLSPTHTGRSRVLVSPCSAGRAALPYGAVPFFYGLQSVAQQFVFLNTLGQPFATLNNELYVPLRVHNGATLTQVEVSYAASQQYTPVNAPQFRVVRVDVDGDQVVMTSSAAATAANSSLSSTTGYMSPPAPASASAWYNDGQAQTFTIPCDQYNVVDVTQYTYWLQIVDATGNTGYPFQLQVTPPVEVASNVHLGTPDSTAALINSGGNIELTYSSGTFVSGEVVTIVGTGTAADGAWALGAVTGTTMILNGSVYSGGTPALNAVIAGGQTFLLGTTRVLDSIGPLNVTPAPVLLKDQANPAGNGIWNVLGGAWTRSPITLTQGMIVPVAKGTVNAGTFWQLLSSPVGTLGGYYTNWVPLAIVSVGQQVIPFDTNGAFIFTCTGGGTSAGTEPAWPTAPGASVVDGSVTWTAATNPSPFLQFAGGPTSGASTLFPVSGQFVAQSTIFLNAAVTFSGISTVGFQ